MVPRIEILKEKTIVGKKRTMSFAHNTINELWRDFCLKKTEVTNVVSNDLISRVIYPPNHFTSFKPAAEFEQWAAIEVSDFGHIPTGFSSFVIPTGLYAVFDYKGLSTDNTIFEYIINTWLPTSGYVLDDRPHFEVLGEKYRNNDSESEEKICIPICRQPILY